MHAGIVQNETQYGFAHTTNEGSLAILLDAEVALGIGEHESARAGEDTAKNQFRPVAHPLGLDEIAAAELVEPSRGVGTQ